jgi:hypothetical protein
VLASAAGLLAVGLVRRWHWSRRWVIALEAVWLVGSVLLLAAPIGRDSALYGGCSKIKEAHHPDNPKPEKRNRRYGAQRDPEAAIPTP